MRIPLLPTPYLEETFGSWFERAAERLRTEPRSLVNALLAEEGLKAPRAFDLDTAPPAGLIESLVKRSALATSELQRLLVPAGGSTLPPHCRDAYCPECLRHDRQSGITYIRRSWLDAWTLSCERHGCALGEFEPIESRASETASASNPFPSSPEAYRHNPSVSPVKLPAIVGEPGTHASRWMNLLSQMLESAFGRDLWVYVGSTDADGLYYELTEFSRFWNGVWHDSTREPLRVPAIKHPFGPIKARISSAVVATYLWEHLFMRPDIAVSRLARLFEKDARRTLGAFCHLKSHWSRTERAFFEGATDYGR